MFSAGPSVGGVEKQTRTYISLDVLRVQSTTGRETDPCPTVRVCARALPSRNVAADESVAAADGDDELRVDAARTRRLCRSVVGS